MSKKAHPEQAPETTSTTASDDVSGNLGPSEKSEMDPTETEQVLRQELDDLRQQIKDQHLRGLAELDNVRKRAEREVANGTRYAAEHLLRELLTVGDSLELGLKAATSLDATAKSIAEGLSLTHRQFMSLLERHGVTPVNPVGQPFNPDLHEAVAMTPSDKVAAHHVLEVMQTGYRLHDRVLRPARVVVAQEPASSPRS